MREQDLIYAESIFHNYNSDSYKFTIKCTHCYTSTLLKIYKFDTFENTM